MYGTSWHPARTPAPVIERFTRRMREPHELCKSIFRPIHWEGFVESHHMRVAGDTYRAPFDDFRINHYWTKSVEECRARFDRGRVDVPEPRKWEEFTSTEALYNEVEDPTIWRYLPEVQARLTR